MKPTQLSEAEIKRRLILRYMQQDGLNAVQAAHQADKTMLRAQNSAVRRQLGFYRITEAVPENH